MKYNDLVERLGRTRLNNALVISKRYRFVYVSNPKAACSSLKLYLSQAELDDPTFASPNIHVRNNSPLLAPGQLSPTERDSIFNGGFFVFTFVRDPLKRVVSAYVDKIMGNTPQKAEILAALGRDPEVRNSHVSFDEFVSVITTTRPAELNPHWRPQILNLVPDILPYDFIGRVENIHSDFALMKEKLNLPDYPLPNRNLKATNVDSESLLSDSLRTQLYELYAEDYREFQYQIPQQQKPVTTG